MAPARFWIYSLEPGLERLQALAAHLTPDERARAAGFLHSADQDRFTAARGRLREVLAGLLDCPASTLRFESGEHGKPHLVEPPGSGLQFNLSHSAGFALLGCTYRRKIGVDLEQWRSTHDRDAVVRRFFSADDVARFFDLPEPDRTAGFFRSWTRKEALVKAQGLGLLLDLRALDVPFDAEPPGPIPYRARCDLAPLDLFAVPLAAGWSGAVAIELPVDSVVKNIDASAVVRESNAPREPVRPRTAKGVLLT